MVDQRIPITLVLLIVQVISAFLYAEFFFKERKASRNVIILSCIAYVIVRFVLRSFVLTPIVTLMIDFLFILFIGQKYNTNLWKSMFLTMYIVLIFSVTYTVTTLLTPNYTFSLTKLTIERSLFVELISEFFNISVLVIFMISSSVIKKKDLNQSIRSILVYVPVSTLFILALLYETSNVSVFLKIMGLLVGIEMNYIVFLVFNNVSSYIEEKVKFTEIDKQNQYFENELKVMKMTNHSISLLKHDMHNHLNVIYAMVDENKKEECLEYIEKLKTMSFSANVIAKSGNIVVDSLINYKMYVLEKYNIKIEVELKIPEDVSVQSYDLAVIIGNLIDNAIEGTLTVEENRYIFIKIVYRKGMLNILIRNSYNGETITQDGKLLSRKRNYSEVGKGTSHIKSVIKKYNGAIEYETIRDIFEVNILLYTN